MKFRNGTIEDLPALRQLAVKSWGVYERELTPENWQLLSRSLFAEETYASLLNTSQCLLCTTDEGKVIGMSFLVPRGNPTEIYDMDWCVIRFVSVDPAFAGQGIGRQLTEQCIALAKANGEITIALHTSEMMDKARHLYESLGFKVLREIPPRFGKQYWLYTMDLE